MFKRPFCQSDIVLGCVVCSHLCVVDYTGGQTFVVKRALVFVTAIALYLVICVGVIVGISYFLVVFVNDRFHVVHTAVANFDVILVEKAVVFVLFWEVLRNKFEESSADVSLDVFTERRVSIHIYIFFERLNRKLKNSHPNGWQWPGRCVTERWGGGGGGGGV